MGYDDFDGFGDFEEQQEDRTPKGLRNAYNALEKKFKEQAAALEKATGAIAQRNLKDVLAEKGLRPGLARVIAKEDVDLTDPKAVETWLSDPANQEDFAFTLSSLDGGAATNGGGTNDGADGADEAGGYAAELAAFQNAGNGALPAGNAIVDQAESQIKGGKTLAEINAALAAARKQLAS
jgi:hypothetical protein